MSPCERRLLWRYGTGLSQEWGLHAFSLSAPERLPHWSDYPPKRRSAFLSPVFQPFIWFRPSMHVKRFSAVDRYAFMRLTGSERAQRIRLPDILDGSSEIDEPDSLTKTELLMHADWAQRKNWLRILPHTHKYRKRHALNRWMNNIFAGISHYHCHHQWACHCLTRFGK